MSAIESNFPSLELEPIARLESWRKEIYRPIYYTHKWWAHRLGSVFRAIVLGALLETGDEIMNRFYSRNDFDEYIVLDPFMGSGTTIGEALKLGCRVVGVDINPVSYFMVKNSLVDIKIQSLERGFKDLEERVKNTIQKYYKSYWSETRETVDILYTFWVKTVMCPNCLSQTRLFNKWIFAANAYPRKKPDSKALCPKCGQIQDVNYFSRRVYCSNCNYDFDPQQGPAKRDSFVCELCGAEHSILDSYRLQDTPPNHQMYALMLLLPNGEKVYKVPDRDDLTLYEEAVAEFDSLDTPLIPCEPIPPGINTDQARSYNYFYWQQMFNKRQLLSLSTLLKGIQLEPNELVRHQLLLLFSGILEFNNMFCSFKGEGTGAVRHLFSHHILKPERTPIENNIWGTSQSSGAFSPMFKRRILAARMYAEDPFELMVTQENGSAKGKKVFAINKAILPKLAENFSEINSRQADALILARDARNLPLPDSSVDVVITDPPYFDNVNYSELADFFHVWLRLVLKDSDVAFVSHSTRQHGEVQSSDSQEFGSLLGDVFSECHRVLKPKGNLIFTFHHSKPEAWLGVLDALHRSNFCIVATHPTKAEMSVATPKSQTAEPIDIDMILVCKKREDIELVTEPLEIERILKKTADWIIELKSSGWQISRGDAFVLAMSQFIALSQHTQDVEENGGFAQRLIYEADELKAQIAALQL